VNHSGRLPVYTVMAGGTLRLRGTVRHDQEAAMRGQLKALVIAGAMLPAGLGLAPLASASAASLDQVSITTAVYYKNHSYQQKLEIIASDTNTSATLTAYVTSTGQQIGLPEGGGQFHNTFSGTFGGAFNGSNPSTITVKSSLGGTATSAVTVCPGTGYC
jgi:hypothetical protein